MEEEWLWSWSLRVQAYFFYCFLLLILGIATMVVVLGAYNQWRREVRSKQDEPRDKGDDDKIE